MELPGKISVIRKGRKVVNLAPGRYSAGRNVYLQVTSETAASWVFMAQMGGKRREIGLGSYIGTGRAVTYSRDQAQSEAEKIRDQLRAGLDPLAARAKGKAAPSFAEMLDSYLAKQAISWKGNRQETQWRQQLVKHCAALMAVPVDLITTDHVLAVLRPIWRQTIGGTQRLRIETVLDHAKVKLRETHKLPDNPARWDGHLEELLSAPTVKGGKHFADLPAAKVPGLLAALDRRAETAARVLSFIILTAVRATEACQARWSELDLEAATWTIPASRMKAGQAHTVPLSRQAVALLQAQSDSCDSCDAFVFPAVKDRAKPLSSKLLNELIERLGLAGQATVHGFRATFRTWGEHQDSVPGTRRFGDQDLEFCLAHEITNKTKAAYLHTACVERRAVIMQCWADYVSGMSNVVTLSVSAPLRDKAVA